VSASALPVEGSAISTAIDRWLFVSHFFFVARSDKTRPEMDRVSAFESRPAAKPLPASLLTRRVGGFSGVVFLGILISIPF
jgi:hypothetical protein